MEAAAQDRFLLLPDEVVLRIFSFLPLHSLLLLSLVCRRWAAVSLDSSLPQWILNLWNLNVVLGGPVGAGKSSIMGCMLVESGAVKPAKREELQYEHTKAPYLPWRGVASFYAWMVNNSRDERERGTTLHGRRCSLAAGPRCMYTLTDSGGLRQYREPFLGACTTADCGIIVVQADKPLEGEVMKHIKHDFLVMRATGILTFIIAVNHMDKMKNAEEAQEVFEQAKKACGPFTVTLDPANVMFVPCSAVTNANIVGNEESLIWVRRRIVQAREEVKALLSWYQGPTLFSALNVAMANKMKNKFDDIVRRKQAPLRICIDKVFKPIPGLPGLVVSGVVVAGTVAVGDSVKIVPLLQQSKERQPDYVHGKVHSMQINFKDAQLAEPGYRVGLNLRFRHATGLPHVQRGMVITDTSEQLRLGTVTEFTARIKLFASPMSELKADMVPIVAAHTAYFPARVTAVSALLDDKGNTTVVMPGSVKVGQLARVVMHPRVPVTLEPLAVWVQYTPAKGEAGEGTPRMVKLDSRLGRILLRDNDQLVGLGAIESCEYDYTAGRE